jgi:hypothetical protein
MRKEPVFISLLVVSGACASLTRVVVAQTRDDAESARRIAGTWRGNSICTVKGSPCHDEINVYRFASVPGRAPSFAVTASKVVDGKEVVMGTGEWTYDSEKHALESKTPAIRLVLDGNKMEGVLKLADGTVYRRISLKKEN